jgi:predicted nucleic acid-binding protein
VKLFLDSSVLLAAAGSPNGASRALFDHHQETGWSLIHSPYVRTEVNANIPFLQANAIESWRALSKNLELVDDCLVMDWPVVFFPAKDRPILFTALAYADVLLTLDRGDFDPLMGIGFYGLRIMKPGDFLRQEREKQGLG